MNRHGIAIPVVLAFLIAMCTFGTFVFHTMKQQNRQNLTSILQIQAHFLARAGMEHALLKVKYLQRELYDAACLAQGRNPLFDFSKPIDPSYNPGPVFLYRQGEATPNPDSFITPNFDIQFASRPNPPRTWLNAFIADLNPGTELSLGVGKPLRVNNIMRLLPPTDEMAPAFTTSYKKGSYSIEAIDVSAQGNTSDKESDAVSSQMVVDILVKAELINQFNDKWRHSLKRTIRISRDAR
jgi:hypothetical protein